LTLRVACFLLVVVGLGLANILTGLTYIVVISAVLLKSALSLATNIPFGLQTRLDQNQESHQDSQGTQTAARQGPHLDIAFLHARRHEALILLASPTCHTALPVWAPTTISPLALQSACCIEQYDVKRQKWEGRVDVYLFFFF
jgi:hypothetical protein